MTTKSTIHCLLALRARTWSSTNLKSSSLTSNRRGCTEKRGISMQALTGRRRRGRNSKQLTANKKRKRRELKDYFQRRRSNFWNKSRSNCKLLFQQATRARERQIQRIRLSPIRKMGPRFGVLDAINTIILIFTGSSLSSRIRRRW